MAHTEIVNPLTDNVPHPRISFTMFEKKVRHFVEKHGHANILLTYRAGSGGPDDAIDVDELARPRTGIYRASLPGFSSALEAQFTSALDNPPRDTHQTIDARYQHLLDVQAVNLARYEESNAALEGRLKAERDQRMSAEDQLRIANRRIEELEAELEDRDEPLIDDETAVLLRVLWGDFIGLKELAEQARDLLDAIDENPATGALLLEKCPRVLLLLAQAAGEGASEEST